MKVNIEVNENNTIIQWKSYPLEEETAVEIKDPYSIRLGVDKFVNGKLIRNKKEYEKTIILIEKHRRIQEFKKKLTESDYKLFKYLEGELTTEEFEVYKKERKQYREEINKLEEEIADAVDT